MSNKAEETSRSITKQWGNYKMKYETRETLSKGFINCWWLTSFVCESSTKKTLLTYAKKLHRVMWSLM